VSDEVKTETAEPAAEDAADKAVADAVDKTGPDPKTKMYTETDVDRCVRKAQVKWKGEQEAATEVERKKVEEERLREQGEFQELAAVKDRELKELQAKAAAAEFREQAAAALKEAGLGDVTDIALAPRQTVEDVQAMAQAIKALVDERSTAEVAQRLDTGKRPAGAGEKGRDSVNLAKMSVEERTALLAEIGLPAYSKFITNAGK